MDVSCRVVEGCPVLEVADMGPGIPVEERERVFDRFYRRGVETEGESGSGLGLAIVARIAHRHGASVQLLDSASGGLLVRTVFAVVSGRNS